MMRMNRIGSLVFIMVASFDAEAAPPGRSWTPTQHFLYEDHAYVIPDRFEPPTSGPIELVAAGYYGTHHHRTYGFAWNESTWVPRWHMDREAFSIYPCFTDSAVKMMVWRDVRELPLGARSSWLVTADVVDNQVGPSDTVSAIDVTGSVQSGTQRGRRRWIVTSDYFLNGINSTNQVRYFCKDEGGAWRGLPIPPASRSTLGGYGQVLALTDSTALAVYAAGQYLDWGIVNDTGWVTPPERLQSNYTYDVPSLRPNPDGSIWLRYGGFDSLSYMRRFKDMQWSKEDTLRWAFPTAAFHSTYTGRMSLDVRLRPALASMAYSSEDGLEYVYANVPSEAGYGRFERIPDSAGGLPPIVTRDDNGDVWLAWWKFYDGMFWVHTYTHATASTPRLSEAAGRPQLSWALTERAPGSIWLVMRSADGGPESPVARLSAPEELAMSWTDLDAPKSSRLIYRLRRECRDVRYQWLSEASAEWLPRTSSLGLNLRSANPASNAVSAELTGAVSGKLTLSLYDLQGRRVARWVESAGGTGRDLLNLPLGSEVPSGLFLLRADSERGQSSLVKKIVLLR